MIRAVVVEKKRRWGTAASAVEQNLAASDRSDTWP